MGVIWQCDWLYRSWNLAAELYPVVEVENFVVSLHYGDRDFQPAKCFRQSSTSGWMSQAEMILGRHSRFLLRAGWSGLGKVLRLFSLGLIEVVFWSTCLLFRSRRSWWIETFRNPNKEQNLTTTDTPSASSFSETQIEEESGLIQPLAWSFSEKSHYLYFAEEQPRCRWELDWTH